MSKEAILATIPKALEQYAPLKQVADKVGGAEKLGLRMAGVLGQETGFGATKKAGDGDNPNVAQIRPPAAKEAAQFLGIKADNYNAAGQEDLQVALGFGYLTKMIEAKGGDLDAGTMAYNTGPGGTGTNTGYLQGVKAKEQEVMKDTNFMNSLNQLV